MFSITGLDYAYGSQIIFADADLKVENGWKVGLIGPNGCGKTTLFRLLTGREHSDVGEINFPTGIRLGYFDQKVGEMGGCDVVEQAVRCAGRVAVLRDEMEVLEHDLPWIPSDSY